MKLFFRTILVLLVSLNLIQCGAGGNNDRFARLTRVAVDSTADRLFVSGSQGKLYVFLASTLQSLGGSQPLVSSTQNTALSDLLPEVVQNFAAAQNNGPSRLFIGGILYDDNGDGVTNRIRVFDFDGTSFTEASFSPIIVSDGDAGTTDTADVLGSFVTDEDNGQLYVTNASKGLLHVYSVADGSEVVAPVNVGGTPKGLAWNGERLFLCNDSSVVVEQGLWAINVTDFSMTAIDVGGPCQKVSVATSDLGTLAVVSDSSAGTVLLRSVDTTTFASASAVSTSQSGLASGQLSAAAGISSIAQGFVVGVKADGSLFVYISELDGNIQELSITADLSTYTLQTLSTSALNLTDGALLLDTSGIGSLAYLVSPTGALIKIDPAISRVTVVP